MQRSDSEMLSEMLSSRSYLDLPHEQPQAQTENDEDQSTGELITNEPYSRPRTRSKRMLPQAPSVPDRVLASRDLPASDRHARKRGRPRLETIKDDAAIEERRLQIRRAQRTYRLKKETTIQTLRARVESLEQTLTNVSDLLDPQHVRGNASGIDSLARTRELILTEIGKTRATKNRSQIEPTRRDSFGYQVSHVLNLPTDMQQTTISSARPRSPSPLINRILPTTTIYTYSHQESNLSRRLHRFSLEHVYRWLTDSNSSPGQLSRVFGLVPCIHDMPGIIRHFRRILQSEIGSALEFAKMPFYTLGGAGTHFPRVQNGNPVLPENTRRPGKILRRMVRILERGGIRDWDEDWSGEWDSVGLGLGDEERARSLDLDGEWFDCHDVQGYLEHRGFVLDGTLRLGVPKAVVGTLYGTSPGDISDQREPRDAYTLDVETFFDLLLENLRILGRAPGFRVRDVDAALRGSISRRSFA